jgi:hypothetical protein
VFGDSEIVIKTGKKYYPLHLQPSQTLPTRGMGLITNFESFNISLVPHSLNYDAYLLENVASKLIPSEGMIPDTFSMELLYRSSVPDNIFNWRVFDDDKQIINFLHMKDTFKDSTIDEDQHDQDLNGSDASSSRTNNQRKKVQTNTIPRPVVRLEKLYDLQGQV